jgi:hypothetical protein
VSKFCSCAYFNSRKGLSGGNCLFFLSGVFCAFMVGKFASFTFNGSEWFILSGMECLVKGFSLPVLELEYG